MKFFGSLMIFCVIYVLHSNAYQKREVNVIENVDVIKSEKIEIAFVDTKNDYELTEIKKHAFFPKFTEIGKWSN